VSRLSTDKDRDVRGESALVLGLWGITIPKAISAICATTKKDSSPTCKKNCIRALTVLKVCNEEVIDALLFAVKDMCQYDVREYAARGIAALGGGACIEKIRDVLFDRVFLDKNADVRNECANTIAKLRMWDNKLIANLCGERLQIPQMWQKDIPAENLHLYRKNVALLVGKLNIIDKEFKDTVIVAFSKALQEQDAARLEIGKALNVLVHGAIDKADAHANNNTDAYSILYNRRIVARVKLLPHMRQQAPILAQLEDIQNPWLVQE